MKWYVFPFFGSGTYGGEGIFVMETAAVAEIQSKTKERPKGRGRPKYTKEETNMKQQESQLCMC